MDDRWKCVIPEISLDKTSSTFGFPKNEVYDVSKCDQENIFGVESSPKALRGGCLGHWDSNKGLGCFMIRKNRITLVSITYPDGKKLHEISSGNKLSLADKKANLSTLSNKKSQRNSSSSAKKTRSKRFKYSENVSDVRKLSSSRVAKYPGNSNLIKADVLALPIREERVVDICLLDELDEDNCPIISVLYSDAIGNYKIATYIISVNTETRDVKPGPFYVPNITPHACMMEPAPKFMGGGLVIFSGTLLQYISLEGIHGDLSEPLELPITCTAEKPVPSQLTTCALEEVSFEDLQVKFLFCDMEGIISRVTIGMESSSANQKNYSLEISQLGRASISTTICKFKHDLAFLGSQFGNSDLLLLSTLDTIEYAKSIQSLHNNGPITDMCIVDTDQRGQSQIVACSGAYNTGSLQIFRSGVGLDIYASLDLPGIQRVFSLKSPPDPVSERYLVASFASETRLFFLNPDEEMEEIDQKNGFCLNECTLFTAEIGKHFWIQALKARIIITNPSSDEILTELNFFDKYGAAISHCFSDGEDKILLCLQNGHVFYLHVDQNGLISNEEVFTSFDSEISCISMLRISSREQGDQDIAAFGLWSDASIRLLDLKSNREVHCENYSEDMVPRSCILASFSESVFLFVTLGDGRLFHYEVNRSYEISSKKVIELSTRPVDLIYIKQNEAQPYILAACDSPTIIYKPNVSELVHSKNRLAYSSVNSPEIIGGCSFNNLKFPMGLVLYNSEGLSLVKVDKSRKTHVQCIGFGAHSPRRIVYQPSTQFYAVISSRQDNGHSYIQLVKTNSLHVLDTFKMEENEMAISLENMRFENSSREYFVVGTGRVLGTEEEPMSGRILIFEIENDKLNLCCIFGTRGAVYCLAPLRGKLVAGINSRVVVFSVSKADDQSLRLSGICIYRGQILVLYISTYKEFILVGDLMKSMSLLQYDENTGLLNLICRDPNSHRMTAVQLIKNFFAFGADDNGNIILGERETIEDDGTEGSISREMRLIGFYHLGEFINRFQLGSLVPASAQDKKRLSGLPELERDIYEKSVLYATVTGSIGAFHPINDDEFFILSFLQYFMAKYEEKDSFHPNSASISELNIPKKYSFLTKQPEHTFYTGLKIDLKTPNFQLKSGPRAIIDGDYVEKFLEFPQKAKEIILSNITNFIEELNLEAADRPKTKTFELSRVVELIEQLIALKG